jgi:hypothetical protein
METSAFIVGTRTNVAFYAGFVEFACVGKPKQLVITPASSFYTCAHPLHDGAVTDVAEVKIASSAVEVFETCAYFPTTVAGETFTVCTDEVEG